MCSTPHAPLWKLPPFFCFEPFTMLGLGFLRPMGCQTALKLCHHSSIELECQKRASHIASATASASTKISTLALAISASTISALQYFDSNPSHFHKNCNKHQFWWNLHVHRQMYHGCFAHLCTSFWTDRRYP